MLRLNATPESDKKGYTDEEYASDSSEAPLTDELSAEEEEGLVDQLSHVGVMASSHTPQKQKRIDALSDVSIDAGRPPVLIG